MRSLASSLLLGFLVAAPVGCGTEPRTSDASDRQPVLWEATRGATKVHLLGTVHVPDERVLDLLPEVEDAWRESGTLFLELDLTPAGQQAAGAALANAARGPEGYSLLAAIGPELHARLARAFHPGFAAQLEAYDAMRPWMLAILLVQSELMKAGLTGEALDAALHARALRDGKRVIALENATEQADVFADLTDPESVLFLEHSIEGLEEDEDATSDLMQMIHWYVAGDVEKIEAYMVEGFDLPDPALRDKLVTRLIDDRNQRMAERLMNELERDPNRTVMVAVGTLHMPGATGLVTQLRERGFEVRRVQSVEPAVAP